ncbi:MAG: cytochrome D1 domain-containing protein [Gammaproteobacteria bacterium]
MTMAWRWIVLVAALVLSACATAPLRGTGDLGVVIERAAGSVLIVETTGNTTLARVTGLGDLSHASVVYSRDARYAYVFGRDGGLTKVDLLTARIVNRVIQSGNSIGGAISQDGRLIAVSNYEPGGVKVFKADTLEQIADIPTGAKVVGLADAPGQKFVFSLFESGEIWIADFSGGAAPKLVKYHNIGREPYDGLAFGSGRYYIAGLFGEDGLALIDLWNPDAGARRVLPDYGRGTEKLPVYKMPHLQGWALADDYLFVPAVGLHAVLVIDRATWREVARIPVHSQPVFVVGRPDGRQVWVNFAHPHNDTVQVIDVPTLSVVRTFAPGKAILHLEFTPRGEAVWLSVRDEDRIDIYDTASFARIGSLPADKPSGIFFTHRAHEIGL